MAVTVAQSEVYQPHVPARAGQHDIVGLEVAVAHPCSVNIHQRFRHLQGNAQTFCLGRPRCHVHGEGLAVYVVHQYAVALSRQMLHAPHAHYGRVVQVHARIELLAQQSLKFGFAAVLLFQAFEQKVSAMTDGNPQTVETACIEFLSMLVHIGIYERLHRVGDFFHLPCLIVRVLIPNRSLDRQ